jgi:putative ABC transport system permease protein
MSALHRKMVRDLLGMKAQVLAVVAVMACGIATFSLSISTIHSLESTRTTYYRNYAFGDVFVSLKRAPESLADRLLDIPGVRRWETRINAPIRFTVADMVEPAQGQMLSLPDDGPPILNQICLRRGRLPESDRDDEVVVSETFAKAHRMEIGDTLDAIIHGRRKILTVVGFGLSPEFVYEIPLGGLLPDNRSFGVLWMKRKALAAALDMTGAFNDLVVQLNNSGDRAEVIKALDDLTSTYGGVGAIGRSDQRSHRFVSSELEELQRMGVLAPSIFLSASAFLLNIVLARMIATQRVQIAALKAFGYSRREIAFHYLSMSLMIALMGTIAGVIIGIFMGRVVTRLYSNFFHFPTFDYYVPMYAIFASWGIASVAAVVGVWSSVSAAMNLPPAEAMRPEPPARYGKSWLEKRLGWFAHGPAFRMILRHLLRKPRRAILSSLGISLSIAVLILGAFMQDAITGLFDSMFRLAQRHDLQVVFVEPLAEDTLRSLQSMEGVLDCEAFRSVAVQVSNRNLRRLVGIQGSDTSPRLSRLVDRERQVIEIPAEGIMLSRKLASVLEVVVGDMVDIQVLEGKRPFRRMLVTATVDDPAGTAIYVERSQLARVLQESSLVSGAFLRVDGEHSNEIYSKLREMPKVANVTVTKLMQQSFRKTVAENIRTMRFVNLTFSCIIAIGVVYSTARISLAERSRDLATLRVLGFTKEEISGILFGEVAFLTLVAIPFGWLLGYALAYSTVNFFDRELFRIPMTIYVHTYAFAAGVVIIATIVAFVMIRRQMDQLSLVEVLKSPE